MCLSSAWIYKHKAEGNPSIFMSFMSKIIAMDLQQQDENAEAASLVSNFSLNVVTQHPNDVIATALYDQELAEREQRANQGVEEGHWKGLYEGTQTGQYVPGTIA
jgi:hypothetical protein